MNRHGSTAGSKSSARFPNLEGPSGALCGILLFTWVHALCFPVAMGLPALDLKFTILASGNIPLALALGGLTAFFLKTDRSPAAPAFRLGLLLGSASFLLSWLAHFAPSSATTSFALPLAAVLLLPLLLGLRRLPAPGGKLRLVINTSGIALWALGISGLGASPVKTASDHLNPRRLPAPATKAPEQAPDVLLISVDTLRADDLFDPELELSAFQKLKQQGLWADYARSPASAALPSHLAMLSGRHALSQGKLQASGAYVPEAGHLHLAEGFQNAGWKTLGVVWNTFDMNVDLVSKGFDVYHNLAERDFRMDLYRRCFHTTWLGVLLPGPADHRALFWLTRKRVPGLGPNPRDTLLKHSPGRATQQLAQAYWQQIRTQPDPVFFFLHFADLHQPYLPDASVRGRLTRGQSLPPAFDSSKPDSPGITDAIMAAWPQQKKEAEKAAAHLHQVYREELIFVDACLQAVLSELEKHDRPAVILLTSDHGELFGEQQKLGHRGSLHESLLRIPFLLSGSGVPKGKLAFAPHLEDVLPTLFGLCDLPLPPGLNGIDLLQSEAQSRPHLAIEGRQIAYWEKPWKLMLEHLGLPGNEKDMKAVALYQVHDDPGETQNLLEQKPKIVKAMTLRLQAWLEDL
ncbi:MAG: hypothetical protein DWQ01_11085 [Planctomycetota bacterium]|nr:MAG: hypothetical protein DWQ01_11085 [Planctomycetota bacterium]